MFIKIPKNHQNLIFAPQKPTNLYKIIVFLPTQKKTENHEEKR